MSRPPTGRRPDSLFDSRYRYDYIYPRGRSGETLRAYDTLNGDQPVVIKRPALQDAPPMRAGQEVSILNEKRALEKLSGHPVLTELRHTGIFRVGGQQHHYIAMDMAQGVTVESMVIDLASRGERLPELEMLVIFDGLLDLLQIAHDRKIIYNDVDAKHLFWDRASYRLKVIDWGNAVFLDSDNVPPHTNRSSDIFQIGQLMYFVVSGGHRLDVGRTDPASDLGDDVPPKLKAIISKAANPDASQRYPDIASLRRDLAEVRRPLEKNRDALVERVRSRLPSSSSQDQLEQLQDMIREALQPDPGFPAANALAVEIDAKLRKLALQADLDAVRIYMMSGNMARASALLEELYARAGDVDQPLLTFLLDTCALFQAQPVNPLPAGLSPALDALFQGDTQNAGRILMITPESRAAAHMLQYLVAERLTLHMPGVVLLRPHLARMEEQLARLSGVDAQKVALQAILTRLDSSTLTDVQSLLRVYHDVASALAELQSGLKAIGGDAVDSPYAAAVRGQRAADDLVDLLDVTMHNVLSDPSRAGNALWHAAAIDPINPAFDQLSNTLNAFHADLDKLRTFTPASDGANISDFLTEAHTILKPYTVNVNDPQFQAIVQGIDTTSAAWARVTDFIALGGRRPAITACQQAADAIRSLSRSTARWFEEYVRRIEEAQRVEYLSPNVALGRALSDGWEAWDRGRGGEAQGYGDKALGMARTDSEIRAAQRLIDVSEALASWLANDGPANQQRTDQTEERVNALFLPEEETIRRTFSEQMPNTQIYLKAMTRGIVDPMRESSSAAVRVLFLHYVLRGILALLQEKPDEANFWKEAALRSLAQARLHPAYQALDTAITRRQLILDAVRALNNVKDVSSLTEARQAARAPIAGAQLEAADQAVRAVDDALRRWPDGEFRAARQLLDGAVERIGVAETTIGKDLTPFKTWLQDLAASAEILQQNRRVIEQAALIPAEQPDPAVSEAHQKLVEITRRDLGEPYVAQLRQWRDTYNAIRDIYVDEKLTKDEKLRLLEGHFASLFIDRQPALPIYRHWQSLIYALPDPKAEYVVPQIPTLPGTRRAPAANIVEEPELAPEQTPAYIPDEESADHTTDAAMDEAEPIAEPEPIESGRGGTSRLIIAGALVLVIAAIGAAVLLLQGARPPVIPVTPVNTGTASAGLVPVGTTDVRATDTPEPPTATFTATIPPTITKPPTATPPTMPPTITRAVPTPTVVVTTASPNQPIAPTAAGPTAVLSPTVQPTLGAGVLPGSAVPTNIAIAPPTFLPDAVSGDYDLLNKLASFPPNKFTWSKDVFGPTDNGWQLGVSAFRSRGAPLLVRLGPDVLTQLLGAEAARHVSRMDVTLELANYEKSLLPTGDVFFGAGFESLQGQRAAVQAVLVQSNVIDLGVNINGKFTRRTQLPISTVKVNLSVQRNKDNSLSLYVDNQLVGQSNGVYPANTPITLYLYTAASGVVVNVTTFTLKLE